MNNEDNQIVNLTTESLDQIYDAIDRLSVDTDTLSSNVTKNDASLQTQITVNQEKFDEVDEAIESNSFFIERNTELIERNTQLIEEIETVIEEITSTPGESLNLKDSNLPESLNNDEIRKVDGTLLFNNGENLKQVLNLPYNKPTLSSQDTEKPIGTRTQLAFNITEYQFSGLSLFDGDSNDNITGATSIPPSASLNLNRGVSISGRSMSLPFNIVGSGVGSSAEGYATPSSNNYNKTYNPILTGRSDGLSMSSDSSDCNNIINNISKLKGGIWDSLITTNKEGIKTLDTNMLQNNYGSGVEIEAYLYPYKYEQASSPWVNENPNQNDQFILGIDEGIQIIQFTTDATSYENWYNTIPDIDKNLTTIIKNFINTSTNNGQGWCSFAGKTQMTFGVQLLTNVMLPSLMETSSTNVAEEFLDYVKLGNYTVDDVKSYTIGSVTVELNEDGSIKFIPEINVPEPSSITSPTKPFADENTSYTPIFIRGNDGQAPTSTSSLMDYISNKGDVTPNKLNIESSNPFSAYLPNMGPAYSAALLTKYIKYPIVWYNSAWVDPFIRKSK
jgi:hypothetical protein